MKKFTQKQLLSLGLAFFLGIFWLFAMRFVLIDKKEVHYHANFAVFVDGERLPFDRFTFYEEIESCGGDDINNPKIRAHMHDKVNHVVHVHDNGATWGHFFANLSYVNGDTLFKTDSGTYVEDDTTEIRFLLNNEEVQTTANRHIGDEDVLLVSIGSPTDEDLQNQYEQITQDAAEYNEKDDPSSCSGGKPFTLGERLKATVGIFD
jgi:hypothetical protein